MENHPYAEVTTNETETGPRAFFTGTSRRGAGQIE